MAAERILEVSPGRPQAPSLAHRVLPTGALACPPCGEVIAHTGDDPLTIQGRPYPFSNPITKCTSCGKRLRLVSVGTDEYRAIIKARPRPAKEDPDATDERAEGEVPSDSAQECRQSSEKVRVVTRRKLRNTDGASDSGGSGEGVR